MVKGSSLPRRLNPSPRGPGCHLYHRGCCCWVQSCRGCPPSCPVRPPVGVRFSGPDRCVTRPHVSSSLRRATTSCGACPAGGLHLAAAHGAPQSPQHWHRHTRRPKLLSLPRGGVAGVYILRGEWSRPLAGAAMAAVNLGCGSGQGRRAKLPSCCSCCCEAAVEERRGEQRHSGAHQSVSTHTHQSPPRWPT